MSKLLEALEAMHSNMQDMVETERQSLQEIASSVVQPVFYTSIASGQVDVNGTICLLLGGPDEGHFWYVRGIAVVDTFNGPGAPQNTGIYGIWITAQDMRSSYPILVGAPAFNIFAGNPLDWRDHHLNNRVDKPFLYSPGQMPLRNSEKLFVTCSGSNQLRTKTVAAWVEDYEEGAMKQEWSL